MSKRYAIYTRAKLRKIKEAIKENDWFTAIVLSASELERFGSEEIQDYLESKKVNPEFTNKILESFYLRNIAECLFVLKIIDEREKKKIMDINTHRNKFIHRRKKTKFPLGKKARETYEPLANEALRILKEKLDVARLVIGRG